MSLHLNTLCMNVLENAKFWCWRFAFFAWWIRICKFGACGCEWNQFCFCPPTECQTLQKFEFHTLICSKSIQGFVTKIHTQICYVQLKNFVLRKVINCAFGGLRFHPCPLFWDITTILFDFVIQRSACIIQSSSIWDHFIGFNLTTNPHFTRQRLMKSEFAHFVFIPSFLIFFIFVQQFDICHHLYYW